MKGIISDSGSHGTGKSYDAISNIQEFKRNNPRRSSRLLIDLEADCPYPINIDMTEESQMWLFGNRISQELFALSRVDVVFTDRTIVDIIAYTMAAGFGDLAQDMLGYASSHMRLYKTIYFRKISNNKHCHADGIRETTDMAFRQAVEDHLVFLYESLLFNDSYHGNIYHV